MVNMDYYKFENTAEGVFKMKEYFLMPYYDSRKSFYKKARVQKNHDYILLYSYDTLVCIIRNKGLRLAVISGHDSQTTLRHIKEFLRQNTFACGSKKDLFKWYYDLERFNKIKEEMKGGIN